MINAITTCNHHGEAMRNSLPLRLSQCLFVLLPAVVTEFSRNSDFSPTPPSSSLNQLVPSQSPHVYWSDSYNSRLSSSAGGGPPKQVALGSGLSGLERMTSFPPFPSFSLSLAYEHSTVNSGRINKKIYRHSPMSGRDTEIGSWSFRRARVRSRDKC